MEYNPKIIARLQEKDNAQKKIPDTKTKLKTSGFSARALSDFSNDEEAYHQLILDIATQQYASTQMVLKGSEVKRIFVDGGFSKNAIYMNLLAAFFPGIEVFAASVAQATALGTALSIHNAWNKGMIPGDIVELKYFSADHYPVL